MTERRVIRLPYGGAGMDVVVPAENLAAVLEPRPVSPASDPVRDIEEALDRPMGTPPVAELARGRRSAIVICDDLTRPTPAWLALPPVLERLERAGIPRGDILIMMALGTHRPMTQAEMERKVGREVMARYEVVNSEFWLEDKLRFLGEVDRLPLYVDRRVMEADLKLSIGTVLPHPAAGWGGGGKMICPGVAGERTVRSLHYLQGATPRNLFGDVSSPVRVAIEKWAATVGLDFTLNLVLTGKGEVYRVTGGHYVQSHREAVNLALEVMGAPFRERSEIVIVDSHPADLDLWQATKALTAGDLVAADGGTVVLVTPCPEGVGPHAELPEYIGAPEVEPLLERIRRGEVAEPIAASGSATLVRLAQRVRFGLVSGGVGRSEAEAMRFAFYSHAQEAVDRLLRQYGPQTRVTIILQGAETLPHPARHETLTGSLERGSTGYGESRYTGEAT
ncbi:MAG: nickel-dependent lactate racemase [Anaerolineae bacterium]|nr:nickel-dependent lactate racemase [Anaerolineae bacterium]